MPRFSSRSKRKLESLHPKLRWVLEEAIKHYDFAVADTHRDEESQNKAFDEGRSKLRFPKSKHNVLPSLAADVVPYPIDWEDRPRFYFLAGLILGVAQAMPEYGKTWTIRWGGNWDMDWNLQKRQVFVDLVHFEYIELEGD